MDDLKLIFEKVLSEMEFPIKIYGTRKFWEEVDEMMLEEVRKWE